ncbi:iron-containing alcohol dehydrogenase family protein [uncultured Fusobacterium sp.]|uniref:iron-containing alcohol dehydrogenase family protein n=1 Tax=uncultured Fusobacterium sp. TaxID=159267 RepID=UPI0027DE8896|nr:iron-containing alcohol dehydrogenase family protein [uncultured Fusobacterium sp.]
MSNRSVFLPNYTVGDSAYNEIVKICSNYGKKVVFIGGRTALEKAGDLVKNMLNRSNLEVVDTLWYGGEAAYANVEKLKEMKSVHEADMVFAFGGGKAIDTCKVLTGDLNKPLFVFPTISSTCAAVTSVCAIYTVDGVFEGLYWRSAPAEHTFINTKIIAEAPDKYLWAGIGDTLAKGYEPEFSSRRRKLNHPNALGVTLSKLCQEHLVEYGSKALADCKENRASDDLEEIVLSIIVNTGLVSNHVINDYNSCVAHAMCYGFSNMSKVEHNHLHGEIVSYGVLVQLMLDNNTKEIDKLLPFYKEIRLPTSYKDFGVTREEMEGVLQKASEVNDVKVAAVNITKDKLADAVDRLEEYVRG